MKNLLLGAILLFIFGCGSGRLSPVFYETKIAGEVIDYSLGNKLSDVLVQMSSQNTTTDSNGTYAFYSIENGSRIIINSYKKAFVPASSVVNLLGKTMDFNLNINMIPVAVTKTFASSSNFIVNMPDSTARIYINAGALISDYNNTSESNVTMYFTYINPAIDIGLVPGDMTTDTGDSIATYGVINVASFNSNGDALIFDSDELAVVRIPVSSQNDTTPPPILSLYYYDYSVGFWIKEGTATLSADGKYYEGNINHFGTWSIAYTYDTVKIKGCVQDLNGSRIEDALVTLQGSNYNGMSSSFTNAGGNFVLNAMEGGRSLLVATKDGYVSNTVGIESHSNMEIQNCLFLGDIPLTVRLTWGLNPRDLDTHIIGPNGYHIWYLHKGNLFADEFAQLDVDDVTSYGPEVFTALSFPEPGVYHYGIHLYSGTSTIASSPAKVVVTLNGDTTIFNPPSGTSTIWWNVFDIIVDESGAIAISPVQTWASGLSADFKMKRENMPSKPRL